MAGARNITGLLALVIVSAFKEATPLPSEVVPACRNRNIPKSDILYRFPPFFQEYKIFVLFKNQDRVESEKR